MCCAIESPSGVQLEREVVVDGKHLEVAVYEASSAHAAPILLLHEGLGSVAAWKAFPPKLAQRTNRTVIAYSRFGYGQSDVLDAERDVGYMHHEAEVVLPQLIARLGLRRPILLGHSDGASIALIAAGRYPDLAGALVLEAPHVFVEDRSINGIAAARSAFEQTDLRVKLGRYHRDAERTFWGWNDIWLDARFRGWNIERSLGGIRAPVLIIQGNDDEYGTRAQADAVAARVPGTQVVMFERCGHWPHRECEAAMLVTVERFLSGLPHLDFGDLVMGDS